MALCNAVNNNSSRKSPGEVLDPRVHPVRKDPQDHVETKAMQGNQEAKDSLAPRVIQEARDLQVRWQITGNNAFGKI